MHLLLFVRSESLVAKTGRSSQQRMPQINFDKRKILPLNIYKLDVKSRQFQRHAATLVRTIEQARHDIGIPEGFSGTLVIGGRIGLWEEFLLKWLQLMREARPEISVRAAVSFIYFPDINRQYFSLVK